MRIIYNKESARGTIGLMSTSTFGAAQGPLSGSPFGSAVGLRDALHAGELSAVEAVNHYLDRIADHGERSDNDSTNLGAFVTVTSEQALEEAHEADAAFAAHRKDPTGRPLPLLHGLPVAHKDLVAVTGAPTTFGSAALPHETPLADHPVVATLRTAGTISLGKTQVPELGLTSYSENFVAAPARNPHDLARTPGGSSGGSAAAVAAGLLPVAPGSDGGGSIRIPALACGLVGLKPGLGTVPGDVLLGHTDDFGAPRLTVHGPLARTAEDAALLMDALIGTPDGNPYLTAVRRAADLAPLTIGTSTASPFASAYDIVLSPEAQAAFDIAATRLEALGHRVSPQHFAYDAGYPDFFTAGWIAGLSQLELDDDAVDRLTPLTRDFRRRALARSTTQHREAGRRMHGFAAEVREMWGQFDVVLTPGLAFEAPKIGEFLALSPAADYELQCRWAPYTSMVNVAGLPAIAVPILTTQAGLPMGVQLIGRSGSEAQLLALAAQLAL